VENKLRILWFCNTPASGAEFLNLSSNLGGWLSSLDKAISDKVDLSVAFYYSLPVEPFVHHRVTYYPIHLKLSFFQKVRNAVDPIVFDKENLNHYLRLIGHVNPDIIHIHGTENSFGCIIDKIEIPVIVSIQGNLNVCLHKYFSGLIAKHALLKFPYLKGFRSFPYYQSFTRDYWWFRKTAKRELNNLKSAKYIAGRTDWDRRITKVLASQSKYFIVNELLREPFYKAQWSLNFSKKILLFTTNGNTPYKGFETLCLALYILNSLGIDVEWRVAGINDSDLIVKVVKRVLKGKFPNQGLMLLGSLNGEQLVKELVNSNIYVMPSHIENSPNNLCEAMLVGIPCIATYAGGTGSILRDKIDGITVQDGDPWALAGAILELHENPQQAEKYSASARSAALDRHNPLNVVPSLLEVYRNVAKSLC